MRNTRHMTYYTRHVQLNSHVQNDRRPNSRRDKRRQKHHTCTMQPTSQTIRDVGGSFHRGLPLTWRVNPSDPTQGGPRLPKSPETPRDATRRHETMRRDATRRNETPQDVSRRLQDASETPLRHEFGANCRSVDVIFGSFLVPLCDTYIEHPFWMWFWTHSLMKDKTSSPASSSPAQAAPTSTLLWPSL